MLASLFNKIYSIEFRKWPPKHVFVDSLEKYLGMNAGLLIFVCSFEFLRAFLKIFVMFVNDEAREIVLILSSGTEYAFSASISIELSKF